MNKKYLSLILILLMLTLLFFACSSKKSETQQQKPIQIALTQDILSFDPMQTTDIFSEAVLRCVYTSLYDFDADLNLRPKLVKSETVIDNYTWSITIHDDVKFHNGDRLTTDDVIFSIERAQNGGRTQKLLENLDSLEKIDDTTFLLRSKEPYAAFPSLFAKAETSIVSKSVVESPGYDFKNPVGAGPFMVKSREENSKISLERFNDYFLEKAASPFLDFIVLVTEQERTAAFLNGYVDMLFSVSSYDCEKLRLSKNVNLLQLPSTKIEYLSLNNNYPPLDNPKIRQAISHAIQRKNISEKVYHGYSTPSSSLIPKGVIGHVEFPDPYNPQKAKQLLAEAGYPNGFELTVITINTIRKNTLEYIKLDLAEIGIQLNYNLLPMKDTVDMMLAGEHHGILVGWAFSPDPNSVLPLVIGTGSGRTMNSSNYSNPLVDELLKKARQEANKDEKRGIYEAINTIVTADAPMVIILNPMVLSAAHDSIKGIHFNQQGLMQYESLYRE